MQNVFWFGLKVFNATFNNISVISWRLKTCSVHLQSLITVYKVVMNRIGLGRCKAQLFSVKPAVCCFVYLNNRM